MSNMNWLRTCGPSPETAAAEGAFAEPGVSVGLGGARAASAGLGLAVSAGCLLLHQKSLWGHRECKPWVSQANVVLPDLDGEEVLILFLQLSHRLWLPLLHR